MVLVLCFLFCLQIYSCLSFNLTILHTNDVHGRFEETDEKGFACDATMERNCYGGMARIANAINQVRRRKSNVVLIDGADRFTGTLWSEVYKGNATAVLFNALNYTTITLGNHDFDYGPKILTQYLRKNNCPVVVSNIDTTQEPLFDASVPVVRNSVVVNVSGEKIGFVGYVLIETVNVSEPGENIKFMPYVKSVQKAVDDLLTKGVNKVIAVGHAGIRVDKEIAKKVVGVDVVVGGHSNTFLYSGYPPTNDRVQGPYPIIIHPDHNSTLNVPVVQAYKYSKYLGELHVIFNEEGEVISWSGNPILMDSSVAKNKKVKELVNEMKQLVDKRGHDKIGQTKVELSAIDCARKACHLGDIVTSAMLREFRQNNATIALFSGTGIRKGLPKDNEGYVLYKDLFESFPYRNTIDMVELTGADLKRSLEKSGPLQMKGLKFQSSGTKQRTVKYLKIKKAHCPTTKECYFPVNASKIYKVVADSYTVTTANKVIAGKGQNRIRGHAIYDVLVAYFQFQYPIRKRNANFAAKVSYKLVTYVLAFYVIYFSKM